MGEDLMRVFVWRTCQDCEGRGERWDNLLEDRQVPHLRILKGALAVSLFCNLGVLALSLWGL